MILHGDVARSALARGARVLSRVVSTTLGPGGRPAMVDRGPRGVQITTDGLTVARSIDLANPANQAGLLIARQAAEKVGGEVGDGTTTALVMAGELLRSGSIVLSSSHTYPSKLVREINDYLPLVLRTLKDLVIPCDLNSPLLPSVASVSSHERRYGDLLSEVFRKVGKNGVIRVEGSHIEEFSVSYQSGIQFDWGYLSSEFLDPTSPEIQLSDPYILFHEGRINTITSLLPILEGVKKAGGSLLIVTGEIGEVPLSTLCVNRRRRNLNCVAVRAPGVGAYRKASLQDLAAVTGGTVVLSDFGNLLKELPLVSLGRASRVVVDDRRTLIEGGAGSPSDLHARMDQIRADLSCETTDYGREKVRDRLARLSGGTAFVRAGGKTPAEGEELRSRLEDAVKASRAALMGGVVRGGGFALARVQSLLEPSTEGGAILHGALTAPVRTLARNAGVNPFRMIRSIRRGFGYDLETREECDLLTRGIVDPYLVVYQSLVAAVSVASTLLSCDAFVSKREEPTQREAPQAAAPPSSEGRSPTPARSEGATQGGPRKKAYSYSGQQSGRGFGS